jgi:hypothetical protein
MNATEELREQRMVCVLGVNAARHPNYQKACPCALGKTIAAHGPLHVINPRTDARERRRIVAFDVAARSTLR